MVLTRGAIARITGVELLRTAAFVVVTTVLVGVGMRWCMPPVFQALASRFVLPEVPNWPEGLWLFLGVPWLVFFIIAVSVQVIELGFWSWLALAGPVWGYGIACLLVTLSLPLRVRLQILRVHGSALVTAAVNGLPAQASRESVAESVQARLVQLGLHSYELRRTIARHLSGVPAPDLRPAIVVERCQAEIQRRSRRSNLVAAVALLCSAVAILTLGLGAQRLWPPVTPQVSTP